MLEDAIPEEIQDMIYSFFKERELFITSQVSKRSLTISRRRLLEESYSLIQNLIKLSLESTSLSSLLINLHGAYNESCKFEKMFIAFKIKFKELSDDNLFNIRKGIIDISLRYIKKKMQNQSVEYDKETQKLMTQYDASINKASMSNESRSTMYEIVYAKMEEQTNRYNDFLQRELALWQTRLEEINSKHKVILCVL
ncbi:MULTISPECIES: hypothetical protein [Legionella]|uniref:F-box domain-containing protein n=1 Tax=Legionella resiliens TaxID=2905958 RepID=A0ABS8X331_9GAMM|nr:MULTISPECIES: hypothetical protein [unclassified Legionella]MCE0723234.1 hypothetical protein [Legionella sp. 9fVS26]MCE3532387.1 hypothetical protein [Legionella sp. 8cVS16]QLZ68527.1 hypothetical protein FOLKNPGA_01306 [Legionella sp. PC1000]